MILKEEIKELKKEKILKSNSERKTLKGILKGETKKKVKEIIK